MRVVARVLLALLLALGLVAGWIAWRFRPRGATEDLAVVRAQVDSLRAVRDREASTIRAVLDTNAVLATRPEGDVVIGLPTLLVDTLARKVLAGWFEDVTLTLRDLRVHKAGDVRARLPLLGRRRVGSYDLDVRIDELRGHLRPGAPDLAFGGNRIRIALPVDATGGGWATIALTWDSRGMANPLCGDLAATRRVSGTVVPETYRVRGMITLNALGGAIVADPDFPELAIRLRVVPSDSAIRTLEQVLASKGGACGLAVRRLDVRDRILALVDRGFLVRIPQRFFRPVHLPIAVRTQVPLRDRELQLAVQASDLRIHADIVWLGARVAVAGAGAAR